MSHTWASSSVTGQNHSLCFPFFFCYAGDHEVQGRLVRYAVEPAGLVPAAPNGLRCMQHQAQLMSPSVRHGHKHSTPTVSGKGVSLKITRQLCWLPLSSCWVVSTPDSQSKMYTMDACGINPANASVTKRLYAVQVLCECDNLTGSCRHSGSMMKDLLGLSALETFKDICGLLSMSSNFTLVCACIVIVCAYKMSGS